VAAACRVPPRTQSYRPLPISALSGHYVQQQQQQQQQQPTTTTLRDLCRMSLSRVFIMVIIAVTIVEEQYSIYTYMLIYVCIKTVFDLVETPFFIFSKWVCVYG